LWRFELPALRRAMVDGPGVAAVVSSTPVLTEIEALCSGDAQLSGEWDGSVLRSRPHRSLLSAASACSLHGRTGSVVSRALVPATPGAGDVDKRYAECNKSGRQRGKLERRLARRWQDLNLADALPCLQTIEVTGVLQLALVVIMSVCLAAGNACRQPMAAAGVPRGAFLRVRSVLVLCSLCRLRRCFVVDGGA
jgi:hypothetical protein